MRASLSGRVDSWISASTALLDSIRISGRSHHERGISGHAEARPECNTRFDIHCRDPSDPTRRMTDCSVRRSLAKKSSSIADEKLNHFTQEGPSDGLSCDCHRPFSRHCCYHYCRICPGGAEAV